MWEKSKSLHSKPNRGSVQTRFIILWEMLLLFNPFPSDKFKALADNNFKFDENVKFHQKRRKHCGKRRNCSLQAILPVSTVFSKDLYCRHITRACLGKG